MCFPLKVSVKRKKVFIVRDEASHFLIFSEALGFSLLSLYAGAPREISGPKGKNFVWALWSEVPQNHVMSKKKVKASADVRISARNKKKTSSRPQAVVSADEFCILNLTILNPGPPCVPGPPDSDPFCLPSRRACLYVNPALCLQLIFSLSTCDMSNLCGLQTHGSCF